MKIEIDYDTASVLAGEILMQDYKNLLDDGYYEDQDISKDNLLSAYKIVLCWCTTEAERKAQGLEF